MQKSKKAILISVTTIATILILFIVASRARKSTYENLSFANCISFEYVTPAGLKSGSISTLVYGLKDEGFHQDNESGHDIGTKIKNLSDIDIKNTVKLFDLVFHKPILTEQSDVLYYTTDPISITISLVLDEADLNPRLFPATLNYDEKNILITIDKTAYEVTNKDAFINLFDLSEKIIPYDQLIQFFPWK